MKNWYTAKELAALQLPGLPAHANSITYKLNKPANKHSVRRRQTAGKGRSPLEYHIATLPAEARAELVGEAVEDGSGGGQVVPVSSSLPATQDAQPMASELPEWKRKKIDAKLVIYNKVLEFEQEGYSKTTAIKTYIKYHNGGYLDNSVHEIVEIIGRNGKVSYGTIVKIYKEVSEIKRKKRSLASLVPDHGRMKKERAWVPYFEKRYNTVKGRSVRECWLDMEEEVRLAGIPYPSYPTVHLWNKSRARAERERGRLTGADAKATQGFIRRIAPENPCDAFQCDGYSFPAYVRHPETGRAVLVEVCFVIDWATRVIVGFSIGLAESSATVGEALIRSFMVSDKKRYGGIPAILYTDGGSGNIGDRITGQLGLLARAGVGMHKIGLPGGAQARGLVERHNHVLHSAARNLWTYRPSKKGSTMDRATARKIYLQIQKNQRENKKELGIRTCTLDQVPNYQQAIEAIGKACWRHNTTPHSGLEKYYDAERGREEYLTPIQCWDRKVAAGFVVPTLPQEVLDMYEYPQYKRVCNRCEVRLHNNRYYAAELDGYHGQTVIVEINVAEAESVKVRDLSGKFICYAKHNGNARLCFAQTEIERAREIRAEGIIRRKTEAIEDQRDELAHLNRLARSSRSTVSIPADPQRRVEGGDPWTALSLPVDKPANERKEEQHHRPEQPPEQSLDPFAEPAEPSTAVAATLTDEEWHDSLIELVDAGGMLSDTDRELLEEYYTSDSGRIYLENWGRNLLA